MEDRLTPGLYVETTDMALERYAANRVPMLLALRGVDRATWTRSSGSGAIPT